VSPVTLASPPTVPASGTRPTGADLNQIRGDGGRPAGARSIAELLDAARARLARLTPEQTRAARDAGAVLVDIRPVAQRRVTGVIPGALVIERNVLEWRLDPCSDARLACADRYDLPVVVYCQEGYTSSLAAAALQDLGLHRATDLAGGIAAWLAAGMPAQPETA
jgi:rhodanese-related sulfurtransferase